MSFWKELRFLLVGGKKDFSTGGWDGRNLELWNPNHPLGRFVSSSSPSEERIENDFEAYVQGAFKENGAVFACVQARMMVFSEARFGFRRFEKGRPGQLYTNNELELLQKPWPGGTTGELLARMEEDVFFAGNFFATVVDDQGRVGKRAVGSGRRIVRLRPDWVTITVGSKTRGAQDPNAIDARILSYVYEPKQTAGMFGTGQPFGKKVVLLPDEICHYSPLPDPVYRFRGMSWLTPMLREIEADTNATIHKKQFYRNSAVPNMVVKFDRETDEEVFDEFVEKFDENHQGAWNAYKTLFLMGGADVTPLSHDFRQLDFANTQGKGEARISAAAGVPASWVGFSEGLQGSGLNAGNYNAQRRRFADGTIRPLWRMASASLAVLVNVPTGAELWYDERDIAFLREDAQDRANIMQTSMSAINSGIMSGFEPDACVEAIRDDDISKLIGKHTGLVSVQMMSPRSMEKEQETAQVFLTQAQAAQALSLARFKPESIAEAIELDDFGKLEEDEMMAPMGQPAQDGGGGNPRSTGGEGSSGSSGNSRQRRSGGGSGKPARPNSPNPDAAASPKGAKHDEN
jgi:phage portal protein BeeE